MEQPEDGAGWFSVTAGLAGGLEDSFEQANVRRNREAITIKYETSLPTNIHISGPLIYLQSYLSSGCCS